MSHFNSAPQPSSRKGQASMDAMRAASESALGDALYTRGEIAAAGERFAEALRLWPGDAGLHFKVAICDWSLGRRNASRQNLEEAVRLDPAFARGYEWLSQWYLLEGMAEAALEHSERAVHLVPQDNGILASRAFALEGAGRVDEAWEILQQLLSAGYTPPRIAMLFSRLAPRHGQRQQALDLALKLIQAAQPASRHLSGLRFVAAELLDGLELYDEAFAHAEKANQLRQAPYDADAEEQAVDRLIRYFTPERMRSLPRSQYVSDKPVLVVGMPRSGTTLVEQIIASHPGVHGAGELDFLSRVREGAAGMLSAAPADYPECLDRLTQEMIDGLSQVYLSPLMAMNPEATRITDKMPLNFADLGFASILLPKARIIHCRRDALDTCLSCYMTGFTAGHEFTFDLSNLGHFYRQYERLMQHWRIELKVPMLEMQYEELVWDIQGQSRRLIDFLGLPWSDQCLRFFENKRFVSTASIEQVRRPVYKSSVGRWRNYDKHVEPLIRSLGRTT